MTARPRAWINRIGLFAIHAAALTALLPATFHWSGPVVAAVLVYLTGALGTTLCYHRALTHRGLRMRKPLEYVCAVLGSLALQGDPIRWVATHRKHHAHSDADGDPHGRNVGFRWAHIRWLTRPNGALPTAEELVRYAPELHAQKFYRALQYLHVPMQVALAGLLFALGGWTWVVWGVFVRLVISYHATWLVNSAAHSSGYRTYRTRDLSTNCWWVALISWGEGWHNNHHAFPYSARHGLHWFEFDPTWWNVKILVLLRLVDRVRIPTADTLRRSLET
ncbi:MAG TPA: fatty acid desaturase [Candidatus Baltobacteraceae bacterium]|nr:fatty acid desaturase [Candidatus Baltobacteraceae bacterium]